MARNAVSRVSFLINEFDSTEVIAQLRQKQRLIDEKRKVALNSIIDIKGNSL